MLLLILLLLFKFLCVDYLFQARKMLRKIRLWQMSWFVQTATTRDEGANLPANESLVVFLQLMLHY
jgi:hypothetical protein